MTNLEKNALLEQLAEKEAFVTALADAQNPQELQAVFAANGLEMTDEEIDAFVAAVKAASADELNENDLDDVSGGVDRLTVLGWMWNGAKKVAKTAWNLGRKFANWESKYC